MYILVTHQMLTWPLGLRGGGRQLLSTNSHICRSTQVHRCFVYTNKLIHDILKHMADIDEVGK